jgi:4-hydroxybenzoate polyprenyltransferase
MLFQTSWLFHFTPDWPLIGFVCSGTVASYNFHWYLTPPEVDPQSNKLGWNVRHRKVHLLLFLIGALSSVLFCWVLREHWFWLGITACITFLYSAPKISHPFFSYLKKVAVGKTIFLAMVWMHVTALLPLLLYELPLTGTELLFVTNRFFFIYAICVLFDYRDVDEDKKAGIRSMITFLSEKGIHSLFWVSVAISFITLFLMRNAFTTDVLVALAIPQLLLCVLYGPARRNFSDYLYYFVLDGLMMMSAPLLLLFKFVR